MTVVIAAANSPASAATVAVTAAYIAADAVVTAAFIAADIVAVAAAATAAAAADVVVTAAISNETENAQVDSYTLALTDKGKRVTLNKASGVTLTVPTNTTIAFPVGTVINLQQLGAGQVTVAGADGTVTVNATPGLKFRAQHSGASLWKQATNVWWLSGDLSA